MRNNYWLTFFLLLIILGMTSSCKENPDAIPNPDSMETPETEPEEEYPYEDLPNGPEQPLDTFTSYLDSTLLLGSWMDTVKHTYYINNIDTLLKFCFEDVIYSFNESGIIDTYEIEGDDIILLNPGDGTWEFDPETRLITLERNDNKQRWINVHILTQDFMYCTQTSKSGSAFEIDVTRMFIKQ